MSGSSTTIGPDRIESLDDLDPGEKGVFEYWAAQDRIAEKEEGQWPKRSRRIVARYRDERPESIANVHRFNILWSNVQTLLPTLYARTPKPDVQRRFKDQDNIRRLASMLLERSIAYSLENGHFDAAMQCAVMDRLLPGRGSCACALCSALFGDEIREIRSSRMRRMLRPSWMIPAMKVPRKLHHCARWWERRLFRVTCSGRIIARDRRARGKRCHGCGIGL